MSRKTIIKVGAKISIGNNFFNDIDHNWGSKMTRGKITKVGESIIDGKPVKYITVKPAKEPKSQRAKGTKFYLINGEYVQSVKSQGILLNLIID